jgi:bacterioferritin (cytochrome b1)
MNTNDLLKNALNQKEQSLINYVRSMREAQDSQDSNMAAVFADLAKAEEKHITVIRDQLVSSSTEKDQLNIYQENNQFISQN